MKPILIPFFSLFVLLFSCSKKDCDSALYCPAISSDFGKMVPAEGTGAVVFTNSNGEELIFQIDELNPSKGKETSCEFDDATDDCFCEDCIPNASFTSITDNDTRTYNAGSTIQIFNQMNLGVKEYSFILPEDLIIGEFQVFNFRSDSIQLLPEAPSSYDEYLSELEVNGLTYKNVIVIEADTNLKDAAYPWVWKVYLNKSSGIIAFYDLKTNSLFGLKNE